MPVWDPEKTATNEVGLRVLLVDDDTFTLAMLTDFLESEGLTVIIFEKLPLRRAPGILFRAMRSGDLEKSRGVHVWRDVEHLTIEADPEEATQADGELLGRSGLIVIRFAPEAINVIVPPPDGD